MYKINKLIGIIKGINFDGVINEKEAISLKHWVDKHRNLAYDSKQINLIKLLDEILEDNIITKDERDKLIKYCEALLDNCSDSTARYYELNGIIEGIICDGEVNKFEVFRLKDWVVSNESIINQHKDLRDLRKVLEDIIYDGIVTKEEQEQLLNFLAERINNSQFEAKLDFLKATIKDRKNIGINLIDLLDKHDAIEEIHRRAEIQLKNALNLYSGIHIADQELVFISLVLIAMLNYDGNFYSSVRTTYKKLYAQYSSQRIEGLIRTIVNRYKNSDDEYFKTRKINIVLANTIVPSHFLKSFFEFIYDIYKLNFEYELSDNLYEDFKFVYEGLRENLLSENDEIQINVTKKSYKLIRSTKQLILNSIDIDAVINLSIIIVKLIDKKIWNKDLLIFNPYLKQGFEGWLSTLEDSYKTVHTAKDSVFRSYWEPKFVLQGSDIYLFTPVHRIKSSYNYYDVKIVVKNGDEVVFTNDMPEIKEIIGGYQINTSKIYLSNPLGNINYQVMVGKEVIYDSKEKLNREFIVFDTKGNEIFNNYDYSGTVVFCAKKLFDFRLKLFHSSKSYVLLSDNVNVGDTYLVCNTLFNFSSLIKPGVIGDELLRHSIIDELTNKAIKVYKQTKFLVYESDCNNSKFEIFINGIRHKLDDFEYTKASRGGVDRYLINIKGLKSGIYSIVVNAIITGGKKKQILSVNFAVDKNLDLQFNNSSNIVAVRSDFLEGILTKEIIPEEFQEDWLKFDMDGRRYVYYIPFEINIYRLDGGKWQTFDKDLWIEDISQSSNLCLYGHNFDGIHIYSSEGQVIEENINLKNKGVYQTIPLGFLKSYKSSYEYVVLLFLKDGKKQQCIFCYNRCSVDEKRTELMYDPINSALKVTPRIFGKGNVFFTILDSNGNEVYKSSFVESGRTTIINTLNSFEKYRIVFYEKTKGLSLRKNIILREFNRQFYAWDDFIGRTFKISNVYYDQLIRGEFVRKKHYFNRVYINFISKISSNSYQGEIFYTTNKGIFMLNNVNPVEIEICSDVIDNSMELSITKEGDGLFLDFKYHGVMNTLDDDNALDIYSYDIQVNGDE